MTIVNFKDCVTEQAILSQLECDGIWIKTVSWIYGTPLTIAGG